jgi:hypothetical protein
MTFHNQAAHQAPSLGSVSILVLPWALVFGLCLVSPQAWAQAGGTSNTIGTGISSLPAANSSTAAPAPSALSIEPAAADSSTLSPSADSAKPVNPIGLSSQNITIQNAFAPLPADAAVSKTPPAANNKPRWQDLSAPQQKALAPLAERWADMPLVSKRKWLEMSKSFDKLSAAEQEKSHLRMSEWVALSRKERTQARLNFVDSKSMDAQQKSAHWQAYQELSDEEKRKLAQASQIKPTGATTVKPQGNTKLAEPMTTRHSAKTDDTKRSAPALQNNTLLPKPASAQ